MTVPIALQLSPGPGLSRLGVGCDHKTWTMAGRESQWAKEALPSGDLGWGSLGGQMGKALCTVHQPPRCEAGAQTLSPVRCKQKTCLCPPPAPCPLFTSSLPVNELGTGPGGREPDTPVGQVGLRSCGWRVGGGTGRWFRPLGCKLFLPMAAKPCCCRKPGILGLV